MRKSTAKSVEEVDEFLGITEAFVVHLVMQIIRNRIYAAGASEITSLDSYSSNSTA